MALARDLLDLASHLARREPRRPRQATLRRAASTIYYALFHLLTDASARFLVAGSARQDLRELLQRAYTHTELDKVCRAFAGRLPGHLQRVTGTERAADDLRAVAAAFTERQQARHRADYDPATTLSRREVFDLIIDTAREDFDAWDRVRRSREAEVFLTAMLAERTWRRG